MNPFTFMKAQRVQVLAMSMILSFVLAACATPMERPSGAEEARGKLTALEADANLASRAPVELREAESAVRAAEEPLPEEAAALGAHRVYMADRTIEIARARATTRYAEAQRERLGEQRDAARLAARTREADHARGEASRARVDADRVRADARLQQTELRGQIEALEARATERGLVMSLGDVSFATGSSELQGGFGNLGQLVSFLNDYPDRRVLIEGHTDNVGSATYNRDLSRRRADAVRTYLTTQGIAARRLTAAGIGMDRPIASNASAVGRQQNRRVEIIIDDPMQTSAVGAPPPR